jgi:hypothetical protein
LRLVTTHFLFILSFPLIHEWWPPGGAHGGQADSSALGSTWCPTVAAVAGAVVVPGVCTSDHIFVLKHSLEHRVEQILSLKNPVGKI